MVVAVMTGMAAVFLTGHNPAVGHGMGSVMGMTSFGLRGRVMMLMVLHVEIVLWDKGQEDQDQQPYGILEKCYEILEVRDFIGSISFWELTI